MNKGDELVYFFSFVLHLALPVGQLPLHPPHLQKQLALPLAHPPLKFRLFLAQQRFAAGHPIFLRLHQLQLRLLQLYAQLAKLQLGQSANRCGLAHLLDLQIQVFAFLAEMVTVALEIADYIEQLGELAFGLLPFEDQLPACSLVYCLQLFQPQAQSQVVVLELVYLCQVKTIEPLRLFELLLSVAEEQSQPFQL